MGQLALLVWSQVSSIYGTFGLHLWRCDVAGARDGSVAWPAAGAGGWRSESVRDEAGSLVGSQ